MPQQLHAGGCSGHRCTPQQLWQAPRWLQWAQMQAPAGSGKPRMAAQAQAQTHRASCMPGWLRLCPAFADLLLGPRTLGGLCCSVRSGLLCLQQLLGSCCGGCLGSCLIRLLGLGFCHQRPLLRTTTQLQPPCRCAQSVWLQHPVGHSSGMCVPLQHTGLQMDLNELRQLGANPGVATAAVQGPYRQKQLCMRSACTQLSPAACSRLELMIQGRALQCCPQRVHSQGAPSEPGCGPCLAVLGAARTHAVNVLLQALAPRGLLHVCGRDVLGQG